MKAHGIPAVEYDPDGTPNRGYRTRIKGGYFPVSPTDQFADLRDQMVMKLGEAGLLVERSHHEVWYCRTDGN